MTKWSRCTLVLLAIIMVCSGCSRISENHSQDVSTKEETQAVTLIRGYFEEPENRDFTEESEPLSINGVRLNVIEVSGVLRDSKYAMDTFAVDVASGKKYFYSQEKKQYVEFLWDPFFASSDSPDGKYRAESFGMSEDSVSGLVALKEMRIIDLESGKILWSDSGFLKNRFLWSPDSNYLAIQYSGRTWTETKIIDVGTWSELSSPNIKGLLSAADHFVLPTDGGITAIEPQKWEDDNLLSFKVEWDTGKGERISGSFEYDIQTIEYSNIELTTESVG